MAAGRNRYKDETLNIQVDGTTHRNLVAKVATDYNTDAKIQEAFCCDYVHHIGDGGFIGGVLTSGSSNLRFHDTKNLNVDGTTNNKGDAGKTQRLSHLRVRIPDGRQYALFNDGGLNTKPYVLMNPQLAYSNFIIYNFMIRSAYFFSTRDMVAQITDSSGSVRKTIALPYTTMSAKGVYNSPLYGEAPPFAMSQGTVIRWKGQATNDEGTAEDIASLTALRPINYPYDRVSWFASLPETTNQFTNNAVGYNLWMWQEDYLRLGTLSTTAISTGPYAYRNYWLNNNAAKKELMPEGWFFKGDKVNGYSRFYRVTNTGQVSNYQDVYLTNIPEEVSIVVSVSTSSDAYYNYSANITISYRNVDTPQAVDISFSLRGELNGLAAVGVVFKDSQSNIQNVTSRLTTSATSRIHRFLFHRNEELATPPNGIGVINATCSPALYTFYIVEGVIGGSSSGGNDDWGDIVLPDPGGDRVPIE